MQTNSGRAFRRFRGHLTSDHACHEGGKRSRGAERARFGTPKTRSTVRARGHATELVEGSGRRCSCMCVRNASAHAGCKAASM